MGTFLGEQEVLSSTTTEKTPVKKYNFEKVNL
jgi:hypothetical protein